MADERPPLAQLDPGRFPNSTADRPSSTLPISAEDLVRFMSARNARTACPMCANPGWWTMDASGEGPNTVSNATVDNRGHTSFNRVFNVMPLICSNCYFVWWIARKPIEDWLTQNAVSST